MVTTTLNPMYTGYIANWGTNVPPGQGVQQAGQELQQARENSAALNAPTPGDSFGKPNNQDWLPIDQRQRDGQQQGHQSPEAAINGKISLNTILQDFKSTLDTIQAQDGVTPAIKTEVQTYLQTVNLLGQKDSPSPGFIRQTLKTAAQSLDDFIGNALKQPSTVVGDWLDALLSQDIDYATDGTVQFEMPSGTPQAAVSDSKPVSQTLSVEHQEQLKTWLAKSQEATDAKDWPQAITTLQQAINVFPPDSHHPAVARLQQRLGSAYLKGNQPDAALSSWQHSIAGYIQHNQPEKAISLGLKTARLAERRGQGQLADQLLSHVSDWNQSLATPVLSQTELLNQMGVLKLSRNDLQGAIPHFEQAVALAKESMTSSSTESSSSDLLPDLFSNLGAAYRQAGQLKQSAKAYDRSWRAAQVLKQPSAAQLAREQLASVYLQARQTEKALSLLQAS